MATKTITAQPLIRTNEASASAAATAFSSGDTIKAPITERGTIFAITGGGAGNVVIKAGNGLAGVNDMTIALKNGETIFIQVDSSAFEVVSGTDKGYVIMEPAVAGTISVTNGI